jgi:hypothetical protein
MSKHTPGPWTVQTWPHERECMGAELPGTRAILGATNICPAVVWGGLGDESQANARLIAASPELLEALQAFVDSWGRGYAQRLQAVKHGRNILARIEAEP